MISKKLKVSEHTIQVKEPDRQTPVIVLLWDDGTECTIPVLSAVRGIKKNLKRPSGFRYEPNQPTYGISREEFMKWIYKDFIYIFDKDSDIFNTYLPLPDYK